jgi:hypothetical protein
VTDVPHGNLKVWCLTLEGSGSNMYVPDTLDVTWSALDENDNEVFTINELDAMNEGDVLTRGEWKVTCVMVDETWLSELPEHDGW